MTLQTIKLSQLRLSPLNVRRVKPDGIEALADDIAAHGLIQNLLAYEDSGLFHVFAGGRRYRALQALKKRKTISSGFLVLVDVRDQAEAVELSLAENYQRQDMHPADAVRAFVALRDGSGMSAAEIAVRFGQAESYVTKLLRLGSLNPVLLIVFAKDGFSLEVAKALTLSEDHAAQAEAFERCGPNAIAIRRFLTSQKMTTESGPFRFVGHEAYEAAGGTITPDLFSQGSEGYADQPQLIEELAQSKLAEIADEFRAQGWSEVRISLDIPSDIHAKASIWPAGEREPTGTEAQRLADIEDQRSARISEIDEDEQWRDPVLRTLGDERMTLTDGLKFFTDEQRSAGGVIGYIDRSGALATKFFRVRSEEPERGKTDPALPAPLYSANLVSDLKRIKTQAVQDAVAQDADLALDILIDALAARLLHGAYSHQLGATIIAERANVEVDEALMEGCRIKRVEERMSETFAALPCHGRFATIRAMETSQKMQLLAGLVALTIDGTLASGTHPGERHAIVDQIARAAGIDIAGAWTAGAAFFDKMRKSSLLTVLTEACGPAAAENCSKLKRAELAVAVAERLPVGWLPEPLTLGAFDVADEAVSMPEDEIELSEAA